MMRLGLQRLQVGLSLEAGSRILSKGEGPAGEKSFSKVCGFAGDSERNIRLESFMTVPCPSSAYGGGFTRETERTARDQSQETVEQP